VVARCAGTAGGGRYTIRAAGMGSGQVLKPETDAAAGADVAFHQSHGREEFFRKNRPGTS
jgi:hypothetical protein